MQERDVAFGERDDVDAGEREALEEAGGVFLVAAESIERFGQDDVDLLCAAPRAIIAWKPGRMQRRAGDRMVRVLAARSCQPWRCANSRQMRNWSAIDASRWFSDE